MERVSLPVVKVDVGAVLFLRGTLVLSQLLLVLLLVTLLLFYLLLLAPYLIWCLGLRYRGLCAASGRLSRVAGFRGAWSGYLGGLDAGISGC